ncbi:cytochrome P450 [Gordonia soli]|uniref:Putative cytochrome P450 n=1 Tax=Gordonia soli NBRC 108243 TaxID=1223545 RepID=M0QHJ1_9ACTN|nr:cytochrome P450 [Gordonia soli]GAC66862.1 putative cytochrome P450 [Gordonia soli NBRC 108243]
MDTITTDSAEWIAGLSVETLNSDTDTVFRRLRDTAPVTWIPALHGWAVTSWEHCRAIAMDAENFRGGTNAMEARLFGQPLMLGAEGDVHQDLRTAVSEQLSPRSFKDRLESHIRPLARDHVQQIIDRGSAELMTDYFEPVSVLAVADSLGFSDLDSDTLRRWFHTLAAATVNTPDETGGFADPHGFDGADGVRAEVRAYLEGVREREARTPGAERAGKLFRNGMPEGELREVEYVLPTVLLMFLGGLQEPGHACGVTFLGLMSRPEQAARVIAEPRVLNKAVAEGIRWMSPLYGGASRTAAHDVTVGDQQIAEGDHVWLIYGSANVDEAEFADSLSFDLDRDRHPHLAFGVGRHSCVGSAFAPQAARIALEELFAAAPSIRLDPDMPPAPMGWMFRGAAEIHTRWDR